MTLPVEWHDFTVRGDDRGQLIPVELPTDLPFAASRVYFITGTSAGVRRGFHAHRALTQLAVSVSGSCRFLLDDGASKVDVALDRPGRGLLVRPMIWHEMYDFSPHCVLAVFADGPYDESDYVRSYAEYEALVGAAR